MTIILFHGLGSSKKQLNYVYDNNKYHKNDFINLLEKIDNVFIPNIPYTHVYYYGVDKQMKKMYNPIDNIDYDDLSLDKYITKLYNELDKKIYKPPYIVMGSSHGIYYACEFAKQYKNQIKYIISLDGSWISIALNKQRLQRWARKGKKIPVINNQKTLNQIIDKIKLEKDNSKYIQIIFDYVRGIHTKFCIKQKYEQINLPFITFRDFNSIASNAEMIEYNNNVIKENEILGKYNNNIIYTLLDATHIIWSLNKYKNTIIQTIKLL
jgi:hypothetical protein